MSLPVGGKKKKESYLCTLILHKHLWGNCDDLSTAEHVKVEDAFPALEEPKGSLVRNNKHVGNDQIKTL